MKPKAKSKARFLDPIPTNAYKSDRNGSTDRINISKKG